MTSWAACRPRCCSHSACESITGSATSDAGHSEPGACSSRIWRPANHFGIEPRRDVVEEGIAREDGTDLVANRRPHFDYGDDFGLARFDTQFDFVLAQSVFSHTYRDLATVGLAAIGASLAPDGLFVGTLYEEFPILLPRGTNPRPDDGSGFLVQGAVVYAWREWTALLGRAGLVGRRIRWYHNRQTWFVAVQNGREKELGMRVRRAIPRLQGPDVSATPGAARWPDSGEGETGHRRRRFANA